MLDLLEHWRRAAEDRGLRLRVGSVEIDTVITGVLDGRRCSVQFRGSSKVVVQTVFTVRTVLALPPGLSVRHLDEMDRLLITLGGLDVEIGIHALDRSLRFRGRNPRAVKMIFAGQAVRDAAEALVNTGTDGSCIEDDEVRLVVPGLVGSGVGPWLDVAHQLAGALDEAFVAPWRRFTDACAMVLLTRDDHLLVEGELHGISVDVRASWSDTVVKAGVLGGVPGGMRARKRQADDSAGIRLQDPILNRMLFVEGDELSAIESWVVDDRVRESMLEVLHGHPGSEVGLDGVVLRTELLDESQIAEKIELAVALARGLSTGGDTG